VTSEAIIQNHFKRPTYGIVIVRLMDLPRGALGDFQYSTFSVHRQRRHNYRVTSVVPFHVALFEQAARARSRYPRVP